MVENEEWSERILCTESAFRRDNASNFIRRVENTTSGDTMAATPKGPQKVRIDYNIDKPTYDDFVRACSKKGFQPNVIVERMMKKYTESGGNI